MKILIAILSCARDQWAHQQVRETWLKSCPVDYRFFVGRECLKVDSDEVALDENDSVHTDKVRAMIRWAINNGYDYIFKCDPDTYVCVPRLLKSGFEKYDWSGGGNPQMPYGGSGYWLSQKAMAALEQGTDDGVRRPQAEDQWIGHNLDRLGFVSYIDARYNSLTSDGPQLNNDIITSHQYARFESYSGPIAPPPILIFSDERLKLIRTYHEKAQEIE